MQSSQQKNARLEDFRRRHPLIAALFDRQREAWLDPSRHKAYATTRRAGKTTCILSDFLDDGLHNRDMQYGYIALTLPSATEISWPILKQLDRRHGLGCRFYEAKLKCVMPTGSTIHLYGADKTGWMERLYGRKYKKVAIDEAAFYSVNLRALVDDILDPALSDLQGQLILTSIPGHLPRGLFFEVSHQGLPGWSVHRWSALDNPFMKKQFAADIERKRSENPNVDNDASFRRNYLGEWVLERGQRVYDFDPDRNSVSDFSRQPDDQFVLGIDYGWTDATAFSVLCWSPSRPCVVEVESFKQNEMLLDKIAAYTRMYMDRFPGIQIVGDPAHRQTFEELRRRFQLPIMEAEKISKMDWIEIVNADLSNGKIKILDVASSPHAAEMTDHVWLVKPDGWRKEQPGSPNDCCDAFLYAFRHCYHFRYEKPVAPPSVGSRDFYEKQAEQDEQRLIEQLRNKKKFWE